MCKFAVWRSVLAVAFLASGMLVFMSGVRAEDAYATLIGTWKCTSDAGSVIAQTNTLTKDGEWLSMRVDWTNPRQAGSGYFQNFFFRSREGSWNTSSYGSNGWAWAGRSPGWKNGHLVFDGIESTNVGAIITRETLTLRGDGKIEYLWEMRSNGFYETTSNAICSRNSAPLKTAKSPEA